MLRKEEPKRTIISSVLPRTLCLDIVFFGCAVAIIFDFVYFSLRDYGTVFTLEPQRNIIEGVLKYSAVGGRR